MYWKPPPSNWCDLLYIYIWLYRSRVELSLQGLRGLPVGLGAYSYGTYTTDISTYVTCTMDLHVCTYTCGAYTCVSTPSGTRRLCVNTE